MFRGTSGVIGAACAIVLTTPFITSAATSWSQTIDLAPGWNIVSTPRVLDSHSFSAPETSDNFDIYVLDASQSSGWATMSALGQAEFAPLYGYFIDNKTAAEQTLTFNYLDDTSPNQRLFERNFSSPGWYSIGVANATYAVPLNSATTTDTNNQSSILTALAGDYDTAIDFTDGLSSTDIRSPGVASSWLAKTASDVDTLNDFRELKGYAVHVTTAGSLYDGYQNNDATTYSLTYSAGTHGSLTGDVAQTVNEGSDGTAVTAVPDTGYLFDAWSDGSTQNPRTDTDIAANLDVTANFVSIPNPAALTISADTSPAAQTIVAGAQNILLATIRLDASLSGEDVQLSSLPIIHTGTGNLGYLNTCQLWDGSTALNTGSDVLNSVATTSTITFDDALRITKGTVKTLNFTCNLSSSANAGAAYAFGVSHDNAPTVMGVISGDPLVEDTNLTVITSSSGTQTVAESASVAVTIDSSSPSSAINAGGTTGVVMSVIKLRASNENVNLTKLGLTLANGTYGAQSTGSGNQSYGASDLTQVYLYNSSGTLLGTAVFTGSNTSATSTLASPLTLTRDTDTTITVKADLANIGSSSSGGIGNLIKIDPLNFEGTGASSGTTVRGLGSSGVAGVRLFKSYPTLALDTLPSTGIADGRLMHFKITANSAGSIGINKFTFKVSTTSATVTNFDLYGFTDSSYSQAISGQGVGGSIGSQLNSTPSNTAFSITPTNPVEVPAGQTYYFELRGSVAGAQSGSSAVTTLLGDSAYGTTFTTGYDIQTVAQLNGDSRNLIWSGNSTSTAAANDVDWSDGFSVPGLPSSGLIQTRSN